MAMLNNQRVYPQYLGDVQLGHVPTSAYNQTYNPLMRTMVLVYVPTWLGDFVRANVGKYAIHGASGIYQPIFYLRFSGNKWQTLTINIYPTSTVVPICSMVLEYLPTKMGDFVRANVSKYSSTMEHMGIVIYQSSKGSTIETITW